MMAAMMCLARRVLRRDVLLVALASMTGSPSFCQKLPSASDLTGRILASRQGATIRAHGRMVYTDAKKQQRVFQISVLQKRLGQNTNMLWSVTDPPQARMRILVEAPIQGRTTVWLASQEKTGAVVLSPKRWAEAILGSHVSIEDLVEDYFSWPKQAVTGEELAGDKMCYVLRSEPDDQHPSAYATVLSWIDQAALVPLRILKKPLGSGAQKEVVCRVVRQSNGHWAASNIEFRTLGSSGSTKILFTGGSENARVKDSEVDPKLVLGLGAEGR